MRKIMTSIILALSTASSVSADVYQDLYDAMFLDDIAQVMQSEGNEFVQSIGDTYLEGRSLDRYLAQGAELYNLEGLKRGLVDGLRAELDAEAAQALLDFYVTETGVIAAQLEATARVAISEDAVEEMAKSMVLSAQGKDRDRIQGLLAFIDDLDLVQRNVEGSMNGQFVFLRELTRIEQFGLDENTILALLAESKEETENNVKEWLIAFTYMAYKPLSDAQFDAYLTLQRSDVGLELNDALFTVFQTLDQNISQELGRIVSTQLSAQDL